MDWGQAVGRPHVVSVAGWGHTEKALISGGAQYTVSWRPSLKLRLRPTGAKPFGVNS